MEKLFIVDDHQDALQRNSHWFRNWGIVFILLGSMAIAISAFTTLATVVILGIVIFATGTCILIDAFQFWRLTGPSFLAQLIICAFYMLVGTILIFSPLKGAITLTLLIGLFFLMVGIYRIIYSFSVIHPSWKWMLLNGITTAILGVLILIQWPISGLYVIGLFVGIDLLLIGWTYLTLSGISRISS